MIADLIFRPPSATFLFLFITYYTMAHKSPITCHSKLHLPLVIYSSLPFPQPYRRWLVCTRPLRCHGVHPTHAPASLLNSSSPFSSQIMQRAPTHIDIELSTRPHSRYAGEEGGGGFVTARHPPSAAQAISLSYDNFHTAPPQTTLFTRQLAH